MYYTIDEKSTCTYEWLKVAGNEKVTFLIQDIRVNRKPAISAMKLAPIFDILTQNGINKNYFLDLTNIDSSVFETHDKKLTIDQVEIFFKTAVELTKNDNIGLIIGRKTSYFPNIVCYIMMNCATLGEALNKYCKYQKIFNEESYTVIYIEDDTAVFEDHSMYASMSSLRQFSDYKLSSLFIFIKYLTENKIKLKKIIFKHKTPDDISEYNRIFKCPVRFEAETNALLFDKKLLDVPIRQPNKELLYLFEKHAQEAVNTIAHHESFSEKVCSFFIKLLQDKPPSIDEVAKNLNMSVRKLQMQLENEGTSYKDLLNNIRKEIAIGYLNDKQISISEVSYLVGFSEPSAFHRAFKRWTGNTPGQYRKGNGVRP